MLPLTSPNKPKSPSQSQEIIPSFIRKTYDILEEAKYTDLIDWIPEGTAIVIKKPAEFAQKVLPAYFKHSNLTSFVRQLNMYDFHKRRTFDIGHVYFHELFQRGKRHLLKEIKRKNSEQITEKGSKTPESMIASSQSEATLSSLSYENQCIKQLYNEALAKISLFEGQVKQLAMQNQSLWAQIRQQHHQKAVLISNERKAELTQDQLPMTLGRTQIPMPIFSNLTQTNEKVRQIPQENSALAKVSLSMGSHNSFVNLNKGSSVSTEASHNSPSIQDGPVEDENLPVPASSTNNLIQESSVKPIEATYNPFATNSSYASNHFGTQLYNPTNGLSISRKETSIGQIFRAWASEEANTDMSYFVDQKSKPMENNERQISNVILQDSSVLGKRQNDLEAQSFNAVEPSLKRFELSVFSRRRMTSTATDENEGNGDIDLMDFRF